MTEPTNTVNTDTPGTPAAHSTSGKYAANGHTPSEHTAGGHTPSSNTASGDSPSKHTPVDVCSDDAPVEAHTGATPLHPELASATGHHKRSVFDVTWEEWKNAQWFGHGTPPAGVPDAYTGASRYFTEEEHLLFNLQEWCRPYPWTRTAVRVLSRFGEHSLGWLVLSGLAALAFPKQRTQWGWAALSAFGSHALAVIIKRIVRRPRPHNPAIDVNVSTPSALSFPSSHATSTTSWATSATLITHCPLPLVLSPIMMASRMLAGVHYPTDVAAGAALGAATSLTVHKWAATVWAAALRAKNS